MQKKRVFRDTCTILGTMIPIIKPNAQTPKPCTHSHMQCVVRNPERDKLDWYLESMREPDASDTV